MLCGQFWSLSSRELGLMLLGGGFQELTGDGRVPDRGCVVDPEHGGEVQRVATAGEGFLELPVDAETLEGGGQAAAGFRQAGLADRPGGHGRVPAACPRRGW